MGAQHSWVEWRGSRLIRCKPVVWKINLLPFIAFDFPSSLIKLGGVEIKYAVFFEFLGGWGELFYWFS